MPSSGAPVARRSDAGTQKIVEIGAARVAGEKRVHPLRHDHFHIHTAAGGAAKRPQPKSRREPDNADGEHNQHVCQSGDGQKVVEVVQGA